MGERKYCKNKTKGSQRGRKWDESTRSGVLMDMIASTNICAVARRWGVPESTIRTWIAEEEKKPGGVYAQARREAARQVAAKAACVALRHMEFLADRVEANLCNAEISKNLMDRLKEDARARDFEDVGRSLSTAAEKAEAAECKALVAYASPGSYDRQLSAEQREEIEHLLKLHAPMDDRDAAQMGRVLVEIAARAAGLGADPSEASQATDEPPLVYIADLVADDPGEGVILNE